MKTVFKYLSVILLCGLFACEKNDSPVKDKSYNDYLSDKAVISIGLFNNNSWILSTKICDTCYVSPYMSYRPMISQLTRISDSGFDYEEPTFVSGPVMDHRGNLYTASQNKLFKFNGIKDYQLILETNDFNFYSYAFDKNDNIWFSGYQGIGFWNQNELKVIKTTNSELPTNIIHGLTIDNLDNVWVTLDFKGLLKISGDKWEIIPNSEIPGLKTSSYLSDPIVDNKNNIWFHVFNSNTSSSILRFDGKEWQYEYPNQIGYGVVNVDSKGTIWVISDITENYSFKKSSLAYLQDNTWVNFDVSMIKSRITTVNSDDKKVYIGTADGLRVFEK